MTTFLIKWGGFVYQYMHCHIFYKDVIMGG